MKIAILHYSAPPVVGGVEAVILAHTRLLLDAGYPVSLFTGAGDSSALPAGVDYVQIPEMNSRHPKIEEVRGQLKGGTITPDFELVTASLERTLADVLASMDHVIVHNIFTKHYNLPLTIALIRLIEQVKIQHCIAWCHDFSWTSSHSRHNLHEGYPWDVLRTFHPEITYVTVSQHRQKELSQLFGCPPEQIKVVYNGVDPVELYSLSLDGHRLINQLGLLAADLILLMPQRITQAKNIEFALRVTAELKAGGIRPKLVITGPPDPHDPDDMHYYQELLNLRHVLEVDNEAHFVYEWGPDPSRGYRIGPELVRELYRVSDALIMPSHREGFGMPFLEAGLIGMPIFSRDIPVAEEIGSHEFHKFEDETTVEEAAGMLLNWANTNDIHRLRRRIRQHFTWQAIFDADILPLLDRG